MLARLIVSIAFIIAPTFIAKAEVTNAPSGSYLIEQRYIEEQSGEDVGHWEAILRFSDRSKPDATLAADPDRYLWPATYLISPDEKWILRLQKTGSGENCALLYRVDLNGSVWRLEQHLDDLAFVVSTAGSRFSRSDFYHVTLTLVSWDMEKGLLHLRIRATAEDKGNASLDRKVVYDLRKHTMIVERG